nr:pyridoxamine 5'-phosphate oxidase family protein [Microbacterium sp. SS28]
MARGSTLRFLGATDTVTGSRYLVESGGRRILIDCGLFQGYKKLRERNWGSFGVDPASIDAVVISHAHLDHTGYLPALVRDGFRGRVHATHGTTELSRLILTDSGRLQEEQAAYAERHRTSRHSPPRALYTEDDAEDALERFVAHPFDEDIDVEGMRARFLPAGHILGAAQVRIEADGRSVHFTGDLGRVDDPLMRPPRPFGGSDVLVSESTYGDRAHPAVEAATALGDIITRVCRRGGVVIIPSFAIGRAESLLLQLSRLRAADAIPEVPIFLNSPMAVDASEIYARYPEEHRLSPGEFDAVYRVATLVRSVEESKRLNLLAGPAVIISASGMLEGGRVLHHVAAYGGDRRNAIVLTGFQAGGTRGAALRRGERSLRIYGRDIPIRAEVHSLEMLSAHADAAQLTDWMAHAERPPDAVYLTHGEPTAADALRVRIRQTLGWTAHVPEFGETVDLGVTGDRRSPEPGPAAEPRRGTFGPTLVREATFAGTSDRDAAIRTDGDDAMKTAGDETVVSLTEDECWDLLARHELGRLALAVAGEPEIFPVNYVVDGPRILFRTAPGSKLAELTVNPHVAFEVDEYDEDAAASVVVKGTAHRLELQREIDEADALPLMPWIPTLKYRWVRIAPTAVTGIRFARVPEPDRYVASTTDA